MEREIDCWADRTLRLPVGRSALLVIDMQRDFLDPEGMCGVLGEPVARLQAIVPRLAGLVAAAREAGLSLIHTREGYAPNLSDLQAAKSGASEVGQSGPLGRFLVRGQAGHDFIAALRPAPGETVIDKPGFGAFHDTDLEERLRAARISHLLLTGVTTQCCVHSTLREAVDRGFHCLTVADCCAAFDPRLHEASLALVQGEGHLFGWIADAAAVTRALAGPAA